MLTKADFIRSGQIRKKEAQAAMAVLGLSPKDLIFLGYPDFGTLSIWKKHWGNVKPFKSLLTHINKVPYKNDFSYGSDYKGENIVSDFKNVLLSFRPTILFVTPPFDLNPDHQAAYLYLQVALLDLQSKGVEPKVYAYLIHAHHWPLPRKFVPHQALEPPVLSLGTPSPRWFFLSLTENQLLLKSKALQSYKSQMAYSRNFLLSFARRNELFLELPYEILTDESSSGKFPPQGVTYQIRNNTLLIDIRVSSPLDEMAPLDVELFSFREKEPFAALPKMSLRFFANRLSVKDRVYRLRGSGILYQLNPRKKKLLIKVPLELLRDPDYLFTSLRTVRDDLSFDFGFWRIFKYDRKHHERRS